MKFQNANFNYLFKSIKSFSSICVGISKFHPRSFWHRDWKVRICRFFKSFERTHILCFFFCIIFFIFISLCNVSIISTSCLKSKLYASNNYFGYTKYSWNQPKNEFSVFCIMWPKMKKKSYSICQKLLVKLNTSKSISRNPFFF